MNNKSTSRPYSTRKDFSGMKAIAELEFHQDTISRASWSPDGKCLATPSEDTRVAIWDVSSKSLLGSFSGHVHSDGGMRSIWTVAWHLSGTLIASGGRDNKARLFDISDPSHPQQVCVLHQHSDDVQALTWCGIEDLASGSHSELVFYKGNPLCVSVKLKQAHSDWINDLEWISELGILASASSDGSVKLWKLNGDLVFEIGGHRHNRSLEPVSVNSLAWSKAKRLLASGDSNGEVRIWRIEPEVRLVAILPTVADSLIRSLSFSCDGKYLAVCSIKEGLVILNTDAWDVGLREEIPGHVNNIFGGAWFSPVSDKIAYLADFDQTIRISEMVSDLMKQNKLENAESYANAKIVVIGQRGVGKSGLRNALGQGTWKPTESTHGRVITLLQRDVVQVEKNLWENREIYIWDLAGQPSFQVLHQLQLANADVALIVIDAEVGIDPLSEIRFWSSVIDGVNATSGKSEIKKILVAAKIDRGLPPADELSIRNLITSLNFSDYFKTCAKTGEGIESLREGILDTIDWSKATRILLGKTFNRVLSFLHGESKTERVLSSVEELYLNFLSSEIVDSVLPSINDFAQSLQAAETCGIVRNLPFGAQVLLKPEIFDGFAATIMLYAQNDPTELGTIEESIITSGKIPLIESSHDANEYSLTNLSSHQRQILGIAILEVLLNHQLAVRVVSGEKVVICFPGQSKKEYGSGIKGMLEGPSFYFEGAIDQTYITLVVSLFHSNQFEKGSFFRQHAVFASPHGGKFGIEIVKEIDGQSKIVIHYDSATELTRAVVESHVENHLQYAAKTKSFKKVEALVCQRCGSRISSSAFRTVVDSGKDSVFCPNCGTKNSIIHSLSHSKKDLIERAKKIVSSSSQIPEVTNNQIEYEGIWDAFVSYNHCDCDNVLELVNGLRNRDVSLWIDREQIRAGDNWMREAEVALNTVKGALFCIGESGVGGWHESELEVLLEMAKKRGVRVIPIYLPGYSDSSRMPVFLSVLSSVDLRVGDKEENLDSISEILRSARKVQR